MSSFVELVFVLPLWLIFAAALLQTGRLLFALVKYPFVDEMEEGCFSFGLGAALLATVIWVLGLLSAIGPWSVGTLIAVLLGSWLATLRSFAAWFTSFLRHLKALFNFQNGFEVFLAWAAALSLLVTAAAIASPQLGRDALAYHFYCPKEFIQKGAVYPIPYSVNAFQPLLTQMLYLQGLLFNSEVFAKLYNLGFLLGTAGMMSSACRVFEPRARGLAAGLLLLTATGFMAQTPYAYTDIALSFFLLASFFATWRYLRESKTILLVAAAIFSGIALAVKLLAVPFAAALFLLIAWRSVREKGLGGLRRVFLFAFVALLPCAGWYLRSYLATGNPIFPYFNAWFTGHEWASDIRDQTGIGRSAMALVRAPFLFFFDPERFGGGDSQVGILAMVLAPLIAMMRLKKEDRGRLLFLIVSQFLFWFYLVQHYRFLFPLVPVLYLLCGLALEDLFVHRDKSWRALKALVIAAILTQTLLIFYYNGKLSRYLAYPLKAGYLSATERSYAMQAWINSHLDSSSKVLLENEPSQYYLDPPSARLDILIGLDGRLGAMGGEELLAQIKARGFTHAMLRQAQGGAPGILQSTLTRSGAKLLHEENFIYGGENSRTRLYELTHE